MSRQQPRTQRRDEPPHHLHFENLEETVSDPPYECRDVNKQRRKDETMRCREMIEARQAIRKLSDCYREAGGAGETDRGQYSPQDCPLFNDCQWLEATEPPGCEVVENTQPTIFSQYPPIEGCEPNISKSHRHTNIDRWIGKIEEYEAEILINDLQAFQTSRRRLIEDLCDTATRADPMSLYARAHAT